MRVLLAACALVLVALAVWAATLLKWKVEEREVGFFGEARTNSLLALERLLTELGVETVGQAHLVDPPAETGVLFWRATGRVAPPMLLTRLEAWVASGGHLVLLLPSDRAVYSQYRDDIDEGRFVLPLELETGVYCELDDDAERDLELDLGFGPRKMRIDRETVVVDGDSCSDFAFPEGYNARLTSFELGEGRVTYVAGDAWAENERIDEEDHAAVAWDLARLHGVPQRAWVVRGEQPSGLLATIGRYAWMSVISLAALTALAIWRKSARFGPPVADEPDGRRDFSEHIEAAASFQARRGGWGRLVAAPRRRVARRIHRARPDLQHMEPSERDAALQELSGLSLDRIRHVLGEAPPHDGADFLRCVRELEQLRRNL